MVEGLAIADIDSVVARNTITSEVWQLENVVGKLIQLEIDSLIAVFHVSETFLALKSTEDNGKP